MFPILFSSVLAVCFLSSCSNTKQLTDGQSLLIKNKFEIESEIRELDKGDMKFDLSSIAVQEPNKKTLGLFRLKLWFYTNAHRKVIAKNDTSKFQSWMMNSVGEPPTIFDREKTERSVDFMTKYLGNKGYFFNEVDFDVATKHRKTVVTYSVQTNEVYRLDSIVFPQSDSRMHKLIRGTSTRSLLKTGSPFDVQVLKSERERIANTMKNAGYYTFNTEYVVFDLDSSNAEKEIDVYIRIEPKIDSSEHEVFVINNVYVHPDYTLAKAADDLLRDTLLYKDIYLISQELKYRPKIIRETIYLKKGRIYRKDDHDFTIKRLSGLGVFKFININYKRVESDSLNLLDVYVFLTPSKKQAISVDLEANSNFFGLLGTGVSFTYRNKNLLKNADLFTFSINSGVDLQISKDLPLVNTADISPEINYYLSRFILPFKLKSISRNANPRTRLSLGYKFEERVDFYRLHSATFSFGYEWNKNAFIRHLLNPFVFSVVSTTNESDEFLERLNRDPALKLSFEEQLILGGNYTYLLTTQRSVNDRNFGFFRGEIDLAGNLLHGIVSLAKINDPEGPPYKIVNREYSQYAKFEADYRRYWQFAETARLVGRIFGGVGIPYGNASVLPYIKQFFAGGANSLRAFDVRRVGPGSQVDTTAESATSFGDQTGDVQLEANLELRFDLINWIKGAIFTDIGNVWLLDSEDRPDGNFTSTFYKQLAVSTGLGLRLDFDFFVIRFDWAIPARDPSFPEGERWRFKHWQLNQTKFNLAIGYPF